MEKETKHYLEYLNHDPNWLKTITIDIDNFLIGCGYIDLFMQTYIQMSKYNSYTSYFGELIIPCLPCLEKMNSSQFQL